MACAATWWCCVAAASTAALAAVKVRVNSGRWADARFGEGRWEIAMPVRDLQGQGLNVTLEALDCLDK